jgi:hypothetical protein
MGKEKAIEILKKHFKALYGYAGMEWTLADDESLNQLVDELEEIIEEKTSELIDTQK